MFIIPSAVFIFNVKFSPQEVLLRVLKFIFQYFSSTGLCFFPAFLIIWIMFTVAILSALSLIISSLSYLCLFVLMFYLLVMEHMFVSSYAGNVLLTDIMILHCWMLSFLSVCSMVLSFCSGIPITYSESPLPMQCVFRFLRTKPACSSAWINVAQNYLQKDSTRCFTVSPTFLLVGYRLFPAFYELWSFSAYFFLCCCFFSLVSLIFT